MLYVCRLLGVICLSVVGLVVIWLVYDGLGLIWLWVGVLCLLCFIACVCFLLWWFDIWLCWVDGLVFVCAYWGVCLSGLVVFMCLIIYCYVFVVCCALDWWLLCGCVLCCCVVGCYCAECCGVVVVVNWWVGGCGLCYECVGAMLVGLYYFD